MKDLRKELAVFRNELRSAERKVREATKAASGFVYMLEKTLGAIVLNEKLLSGKWIFEHLTGSSLTFIQSAAEFPKIVRLLGKAGRRSLDLPIKKQIVDIRLTNAGDIRLTFNTIGFDKVVSLLGDIDVDLVRVNDEINKRTKEVGDLVLIKQFVEKGFQKKEATKR